MIIGQSRKSGIIAALALRELGCLLLALTLVLLAFIMFVSLVLGGGAYATQTADSQNIVSIAEAIESGQPLPQANWRGGIVTYSWGGGHGATPGPSLGICDGYTGSIQPCPSDHTVGVDCSGFARWVYSIAFGKDVLDGGTNTQIANPKLHQVSAADAVPGDLVFFGTSPANTHHVGIYIGNGKMINALRTGTNVETDPLLSDLVGYYHYDGGSANAVSSPTP